MMATMVTTIQPSDMGASTGRWGGLRMHVACQLLAVLLLPACGGGIKPVAVGSSDSGGGEEVGAADGGGEGEDGADGGEDGDGGGDDGDDGGRVEVEVTVSWITRVDRVDVCTATLVEENVPTSWAEWGVWTDIDPDLAEPAPDPLPDPILANVPLGQGTSAGHGSWRFSLDGSSEAHFAAYAALAEGGGDHRLVCVLTRGSEAIPHSVVETRPLPALDEPLDSVDVLLRVIWSD